MIPLTDEWALREAHENMYSNDIILIHLPCYNEASNKYTQYFNFCAYFERKEYYGICNGCKKPVPKNLIFYVELNKTFGE